MYILSLVTSYYEMSGELEVLVVVVVVTLHTTLTTPPCPAVPLDRCNIYV